MRTPCVFVPVSRPYFVFHGEVLIILTLYFLSNANFLSRRPRPVSSMCYQNSTPSLTFTLAVTVCFFFWKFLRTRHPTLSHQEPGRLGHRRQDGPAGVLHRHEAHQTQAAGAEPAALAAARHEAVARFRFCRQHSHIGAFR